jgi:hypothetical protein
VVVSSYLAVPYLLLPLSLRSQHALDALQIQASYAWIPEACASALVRPGLAPSRASAPIKCCGAGHPLACKRYMFSTMLVRMFAPCKRAWRSGECVLSPPHLMKQNTVQKTPNKMPATKVAINSDSFAHPMSTMPSVIEVSLVLRAWTHTIFSARAT